jgi:uncharacterized protein (TIGR02118 family)
MVKVIAFLRRRADLTFDDFVEHWSENHSVFVRELPGIRRYVQNAAHLRPGREWPYDGVAELWFDDVAAVKIAFASEAAEPMREDEGAFIDSMDWLLVDENEMWVGSKSSSEPE